MSWFCFFVNSNRNLLWRFSSLLSIPQSSLFPTIMDCRVHRELPIIIRGQREDNNYATLVPQFTFSWHCIIVVLHLMLYMYIHANWKYIHLSFPKQPFVLLCMRNSRNNTYLCSPVSKGVLIIRHR